MRNVIAERERAKRWYNAHKERAHHNNRSWKEKNPERAREIARAATLRCRYKRLEKAAGRPRPKVCEIPGCGGTYNISFDHSHQNGKFRGWICNGCNRALGYAGDRAEILRKLADYLDAHQ